MSPDDGESTSNDGREEKLQFDPERGTRLRLAEPVSVSRFDVETLERIKAFDVTTETVDGEEVVTECEIDVGHLATIASELDTVERRLSRWEHSGWNPAIRTKQF